MRTIASFGQHVLGFLDWLVSFLERLVTLSIGVAIGFVGWRLISSKTAPEVVTTLGQNWKALLLLLVPLLYQTIRKFLDEVEEAFGMKRQKKTGNVIERGAR